MHEKSNLTREFSQSRDISERFPDQEYQVFKRSKAENAICKWLYRAYCGKQISAFYLIWDNLQYSILEDLENPFLRRLCEVFYLLKDLPKNSLKVTPKLQQRFPNMNLQEEESQEPQYEDHSQMGLSHPLTDTQVYVESEFTSMGGSDKQITNDFNFSTMKSEKDQKKSAGHFKNKSNNFVKKLKPNKIRNSYSGDIQNEETIRSNFQKKIENYFYQENMTQKIRKNEEMKDSKRRPKNLMRKLRETLEKEEIETINKTHFPNSAMKNKPKLRRLKKDTKTNFSFSNNTIEPDFSTFGQTQYKTNFFKKNGNFKTEKNKTMEESKEMKEASPVKKTAIGRVFYLLSKRFQDTRYKNFFMDQVEILVYKHGIRDPQIMSLLKNLDLRFEIDELCPEESEVEEDARKGDLEKQAKMQRRLEKQYTRENIEKLERVIELFRADQLFAPLIRHFIIKKMSFNRHFFVNLRMFSKLAPFRKLHQSVQNRVALNQKAAFSQILFYVKPNLRLLLLMFAISKVKQRHIVDAFRRIYAFYYEILKKEKQEKENASKLLINLI